MPHSHWDKKRFPEIAARRVCQLPKAECDRRWTEYQHGHEGRPCEKTVLPGNKTETCKLSMTPEELEARLSRRVKS